MKVFQLELPVASPSSTWITYKAICLLVNATGICFDISSIIVSIFAVVHLSEIESELNMHEYALLKSHVKIAAIFVCLWATFRLITQVFALRFVYTNSLRSLLTHICLTGFCLFFTLVALFSGNLFVIVFSAFLTPMSIVYLLMMTQMLLMAQGDKLLSNTW